MLDILKISLHDNDFTIIIEFSSELLKELIDFFDYYGSYEISEKDLYKLQDSIQHLLYATYRIHNYLFHRDYEDIPFDSFRPSLHIVDYLDIPEWSNHDSVFIPLFKGDIIVR